MKIYHRSSQTNMTETLLYVQQTLAILKQMACSTMAQCMDSDGTVKAGLRQRILQYDSDISGFDGLGRDSSAMSLENEVITGEPLLENAQQEQQLCGDSYAAVLFAFSLIYEYLLAVKTDVIPLEAASLANPESTVIDGGEQCFVIQVTETDKPFYLFLREHTREPLGLAYLGQDKSSRFLESHALVVALQSKHGMLEMRNSVTVPVQEHRQIVIDICLCKVIRKFLKIQYGLGYLQAVVVDTAVGILGQTKFLGKQRTDAKPSAIQACLVMAEVRRRKTKLDAFLKFGNSFNRPVQGVVGHGALWCRGLMTGLLEVSRYLPAPLIERKLM